MAGAEYEAIAIGPVGGIGIVLEIFAPQHGGDVGHAHRHSRVAGIGSLHRIHRKRPDGIGHLDHARCLEAHAAILRKMGARKIGVIRRARSHRDCLPQGQAGRAAGADMSTP